MKSELLHVVTCYYNPVRWESRLRLYKQFEQHMLDCGVTLTTIECALGERPFELDTPNVNHVKTRAKTLVWNKESLLRIGMARLPDLDWKYVCWVDADIYFRKPDWASETVHALQQYDVIQPWSDAYDLGPNDSHLAVYKSFCHQYWWGKSVVYGVDPEKSAFEKRVQGVIPSARHTGFLTAQQPHPEVQHEHHHKPKHHHHHKHHHHKHHPHHPHVNPPPYYGFIGMQTGERMPIAGARVPWWKGDGGPHEYPHTGYAWAATRQAMEATGGLFDIAAMGAGDYHMALALIGHGDRSIPQKVNPSYHRHLKEWETRALRDINYNIGYIQGTIEHHFHGPKADRRYIDRWHIALEHDFDPDTDLMRNTYGVLELTCRKPKLRHDLDVYLRQRNEDANSL